MQKLFYTTLFLYQKRINGTLKGTQVVCYSITAI